MGKIFNSTRFWFGVLIVSITMYVTGVVWGEIAKANVYCGNSHYRIVEASGMGCGLASAISNESWDLNWGGYNVSFAVWGQFVYCYKQYDGQWYVLCEPHPNGGWVLDI